MSKPYTTKDLKDAITAMEDEELPLDAKLEVYIDGKTYNVVSVGHFHVVPNMVIELKIKPTESI